jgi:hypothetical protein
LSFLNLFIQNVPILVGADFLVIESLDGLLEFNRNDVASFIESLLDDLFGHVGRNELHEDVGVEGLGQVL